VSGSGQKRSWCEISMWLNVAADSRENLTLDNRWHFGRLTNRTLLYYVKTHLALLLGLCLSSTANFRLFRGVRKIVKSDYSLVMSVCPSLLPSARPPSRPQAPTERIFMELLFEYFSKIFPENSSFIKIWQEYQILYTKSIIRLW